MIHPILMEYGPNQGKDIMKYCLNCGTQLHKDNDTDFCNAECDIEYFSQEEYVCSCFDDEPDADEAGLGEVDEQQENQDFAQDDCFYPGSDE